MKISAEKLKISAPLFLRAGLGTVFLLFGLQKLIFPAQGTSEIQLIFTSEPWQWTMSLGMASAMNYYIGLAEIMLGISLFAGWMIPYAAPAGALLILGIFASIWFKYGFNTEDKTILLDAGLIGAALALWALTMEKVSAYAPDLSKSEAIGNKSQSSEDLRVVAPDLSKSEAIGNKSQSSEVVAPIILRIGLAFAFFLSGYQKIIAGEMIIGFFALALAAFLLAGRGVRYAALLCALFVAVSFGGAITAHGILVGGILPDPALSRDIGVIAAALALWALSQTESGIKNQEL